MEGRSKKKGFTLVEIVTVLTIIGIGSVILFQTFIFNWSAFEREIARIDLDLEANQIIEQISFDIRIGEQKSISTGGDTLILTFPSGAQATYRFLFNPATGENELQMIKGGVTTTLSQNIDLANSNFQDNTESVIVNLTLVKELFGIRRTQIVVRRNIEVFLRNL
ncbi:MAG: hypothetical protein B6D56_06145 [Candidatus Omnitrophica bacterium 4484_70.1]|nr:MAG: hypothetical protein B6D56_06145 [Candidatus Omnitrophica bacterium 4484_70.1]